jgi:hypothetical protein
MHFYYTTKISCQIKPLKFQEAFRHILGPQNKDHVYISENIPTCNRLQSSMLIQIWVVIAFEPNKWNTNVDHITNENTFTILKTVLKA